MPPYPRKQVAPTAQRQAHGADAERLVASWLQRRGLSIVAQNLRLGHFELDIVARDGPLVVIVEVRTRGSRSRTSGLSSIGREKRRRLRAAGHWLWDRRYRSDPSVERMRFDVASVVYGPSGAHIEYVPAAF